MTPSNGGFTLLEVTIAMAVIMVVVSGIFLGIRANSAEEHRALYAAALTFQSDMRYIQRRAIMEGREFSVRFDTVRNRYTLETNMPFGIIRHVYLEEGVRLLGTTIRGIQRAGYTARGTPTQVFTLRLGGATYIQPITVTLGGGKVIIHDRE